MPAIRRAARICAAAILMGGMTAAQDATQSSSKQAHDLLARADAPLFSAATYRLAGTAVTKTILPVARTTDNAFAVAATRDGHVRVEDGSLSSLRLSIFDGSILTDYRALNNSYTQTKVRSVPEAPLMRILRFGHDPRNVLSAEMEKSQKVEFRGQPTPCYVVRANYNGFAGDPNARNVVRTVWITRDRSIIVRDSWELEMTMGASQARGGTAYNFTTVEWDTEVPGDLFVFHPPEGSQAMASPTAPATLPGGPAAIPSANGIGSGGGIGSGSGGLGTQNAGGGTTVKMTLAALRRKVEADYSAEARAAGIQGSVLVAAEIDEVGHVASARVIRGLGLGLDEKAAEAVRHWEFSPAARDGVSIRSTRTYEVDFRLPERGPWHVDGIAYRPRLPDGSRVPVAEISKPAFRQWASPDAAACPGRGYVSLEVHIGADGMPGEVKSSQSNPAADAAVRAAQSWSFEPAMARHSAIPADASILLECGEGDWLGNPVEANAPASRVGGGVTAPVILFKVEPEYSEEARKSKFQGSLLLSVVVDPAGRPSQVRVLRSLGLGLDEKAIESVAQWRFKPGMKEGKPVSVQATIEVNFKLL